MINGDNRRVCDFHRLCRWKCNFPISNVFNSDEMTNSYRIMDRFKVSSSFVVKYYIFYIIYLFYDLALSDCHFRFGLVAHAWYFHSCLSNIAAAGARKHFILASIKSVNFIFRVN